MDGVAFPEGDVFSRVVTDGILGGTSRPPESPLPFCLRRFRGGGGAGRNRLHGDVATDEDAHAVDFEEGLLSFLKGVKENEIVKKLSKLSKGLAEKEALARDLSMAGWSTDS